MKIAVIGASGMVGSRVVAEAVARGHEVDAYTRSGKEVEGATAHKLQLANTAETTAVINSHDFTVITVTGDRANLDYSEVSQAHADLIAAAPQGRFLVVGGAGSLFENGAQAYTSWTDDNPYLAEASAFAKVYDRYIAEAGELKWSMISPSPVIAPGVRTGEIVLGSDEAVGQFVSAEDFAIAIVDEAEQGSFTGKRFTAASKNEQAAQGK